MKENIDHAIKQLTPILLSGLLAGLVAFVQALASNHGYSCAPTAPTETAGALGMAMKAAHTIIKLPKVL